MDRHEEFRELCAISISDELTCEERARLDEDLQAVYTCKKNFHKYRAAVVSVLPQFAAEEVPSEWPPVSYWDAEEAEAAFFERLKARGGDDLPPRPCLSESTVAGRPAGYISRPALWKEFGMLYAAGTLLFLALT